MLPSKTHRIASLLLLLLTAAYASGSPRPARQATRCGTGTECIPLGSCPALANLLRDRTRENLMRVREALCNNNRNNPKVCCGSEGTSTESPVSSVTPPVSSVTPPVSSVTPPVSSSETPTDSGNPGGGEMLLPSVCGMTGTRKKIFNGVEVRIGSFPWMAILGYTDRSLPDGLDWGCGGALINDRYILTAAHCVVPSLPLEEIRLGEHHLDTDPDCSEANCPKHQTFKITRSQIISHPNYDTRTPFSDDIALIRLDRKATYNRFVGPACLPETQFDVQSFLSGRNGTVAGWGNTEGGSKSRVLKSVGVPFVNIDTCQPLYQNLLNSDQLCFGGEGGRDSCSGDSGGPLFQASSTGTRTTIIGVVSFGNSCGGDPAIYTKVSSYRSWIVQNLRP